MATKVVILSAFLSPQRSGAEAMVEEVAQRLGTNYDITIVTGRYNRALPRHEALGSVHVVRVGLGLGLDKWLFPLLGAIKAGQIQPKILHAVLESYAGLAMVLSKFFCSKAKRILTLQSTNTTLFLGAMHRSAQRITAISSALVARAKEYGRDDVALIPNGIPFKEINDACRFHQKVPKRVLFVGRLESMKGVDTLLRAVAHIPEAQLRVVGDGSQRESLIALARTLGIADRTTFVGKVGAAQVFDEYAQAAIFCGLSRSEALGNVFLEAQAAGCAVVATNTGGIPDIVHDTVDGLLIEPDNVEQATESIKKLLSDYELCERLAKAGKQGKERYDWSVIAKKYAKLYEELAGSR